MPWARSRFLYLMAIISGRDASLDFCELFVSRLGIERCCSQRNHKYSAAMNTYHAFHALVVLQHHCGPAARWSPSTQSWSRPYMVSTRENMRSHAADVHERLKTMWLRAAFAHSHREGAFCRHHLRQLLTVKGRSFEIIRPLHRALRAAKDFMGYASNFT